MNESLIHLYFSNFFKTWAESQPLRHGFHASSFIIDRESFCYRAQVLQCFFKQNGQQLSAKTLAIYLEGKVIHQKWQDLFSLAGILESAEKAIFYDRYGIYFTPDAIIKMLNKRFIVEIKSMREKYFLHLKKAPSGAVKQLQFYMHLLAIHDGIVLIENKNTQDFMIFLEEYNPECVKEPLRRLYVASQYLDNFEHSDALVEGNCKSQEASLAKTCSARVACFATNEERELLRL